MSMYNCGVFERNMREHADQPGVLLAASPINSSVCFCSAARPERAAILDHQLETAGRADARHRRSAEHADHGLGHFCLAHRAQLGHDRVGLQLGFAPLVEWFEHDEHRAEVRAVGAQQSRLPDTATVAGTPGVCAAIASTASHHFLRALHRRRVGQLHVDQQPPWSCCGMNPVGIRVNNQYVSPAARRKPTARSRHSRTSQPTMPA